MYVSSVVAINTDQYRVICASNLGAPFGTTSPISLNPNTQQAYGASFPQITPRDIARVAWLLLDELGVRKLHAVVRLCRFVFRFVFDVAKASPML